MPGGSGGARDRGADAVRLDHRDRGVGDAGALGERALRQSLAQAQAARAGADIEFGGGIVHVFSIWNTLNACNELTRL